MRLITDITTTNCDMPKDLHPSFLWFSVSSVSLSLYLSIGTGADHLPSPVD